MSANAERSQVMDRIASRSYETPPLGLILLLLSLFGSACDGGFGSANRVEITLSGTVDAYEADLGFQVAGRIVSLEVDEGDLVTPEQLLARLDPRDYELALEQTRARAQAAKMTLSVLEAGTREQELKVAAAALARSESELKFARSEVRRFKKLVPKRLASQEELERAELQAKIAEAGVEQAEQALNLLHEGPRQAEIERAAAEYAASQAAVAIAEQQLAYTHLNSPIGGVVSVRLAETGEIVSHGQAVVRVAELDRPWVRGYLNGQDLARVKLGQEAEVRVDGLPDRTFKGTLSFVSPQAEFTPKTVETRELRVDLVYRIKINVANPDGVLKIGMPADISLHLSPPQ